MEDSEKFENSFLYLLEFKFLPELFLSSKSQEEHLRLILNIFSLKENIWKPYLENSSKYTHKDFETKVRKISFDGKEVDLVVIQIECPKVKETAKAHRIFVCYDKNESNPRYFTIEYGKFHEEYLVLCEQTLKMHLLYFKVEDDVENQLDKVIDLYLNKES